MDTKDASRTDEELVLRALADDRYYGMLVERYEAKLQRYIMRLINCGMHDAQDISQETFINAYRNLNGFDANLKFSSWIYRIAHNEALSHIRRIVSHPAVELDDTFETLASELNVERGTERKLAAERLRAAVHRLDGKYRDALILRYLEERDYAEISDILRKPLGSVSSLILRAKKALLKELQNDVGNRR